MSTFSEIPWIAEHIELYKNDPEQAHMWDSSHLGGPGLLPTLLLTTIGRKTGEPRPLPLIYKEIDGAYVIIASKGGMPNHPIWFLNLEANPRCELMVGAKAVSAVARVAEEVAAVLYQRDVLLIADDADAMSAARAPAVIAGVVPGMTSLWRVNESSPFSFHTRTTPGDTMVTTTTVCPQSAPY